METQGLLLLKRLRKLYWDHNVQPERFSKANFPNRLAGRPSQSGGVAKIGAKGVRATRFEIA